MSFSVDSEIEQLELELAYSETIYCSVITLTEQFSNTREKCKQLGKICNYYRVLFYKEVIKVKKSKTKIGLIYID